jgi:hypothetical protein
MDTIYRNAEITLVAAAGKDAGHGLPGVSNDRIALPVVNFGDISILSMITHTRDAITNSTWNTRGWTYQEAILSRRRLVFTEEEVYFECAGINCFEGSPHNLAVAHQTSQENTMHNFLQAGVFSAPKGGGYGSVNMLSFSHIMEYEMLLEQYCWKTLSYPVDRLNAFTGIMKRFDKGGKQNCYL